MNQSYRIFSLICLATFWMSCGDNDASSDSTNGSDGGGDTDTDASSDADGDSDSDSDSDGDTDTDSDTDNALTYPIVDTNQLECYGSSTEMTCPDPGESFYGQDAQYDGAQPRYKNNGDGTVTDLVTGLMWQKGYGQTKLNYDQAMSQASTFDLAGYDDWRVPTIKEQFSLILFSGNEPNPNASDASGVVPFLDDHVFDFRFGDPSAGQRVIDAQYISSTKYVSTTMGGNETVFGVNFADGRIKGYPASRDMFEIKYVRGNPDYGTNTFVDNKDGTISDLATGLMWSEQDSGDALDWEEALAWIEAKNDTKYLGYYEFSGH